MSEERVFVLPQIAEIAVTVDEDNNLLIEQDVVDGTHAVFVPQMYVQMFVDMICDAIGIGPAGPP